jgi:hypothetical protein
LESLTSNVANLVNVETPLWVAQKWLERCVGTHPLSTVILSPINHGDFPVNRGDYFDQFFHLSKPKNKMQVKPNSCCSTWHFPLVKS